VSSRWSCGGIPDHQRWGEADLGGWPLPAGDASKQESRRISRTRITHQCVRQSEVSPHNRKLLARQAEIRLGQHLCRLIELAAYERAGAFLIS
jgi:hypothetical protein